MGLDWKPRHRDTIIGDIAWLARITDKANAKLAGTIGDYIYPWPADQKFLEEQIISAEAFVKMVKKNPSDAEMIGAMKSLNKPSKKKSKSKKRKSWCIVRNAWKS